MKAKYLGHPDLRDESPRTVAFAGVTFPRGHFVAVDSIGEKPQAKLRANPAFVVSDDDLTEDEQAAADAAANLNPAPSEASDKPDVGQLDKPSLIARLTELKAKHPEADFSFTEKMSAAKLRQVLEEAQFIIGDED